MHLLTRRQKYSPCSIWKHLETRIPNWLKCFMFFFYFCESSRKHYGKKKRKKVCFSACSTFFSPQCLENAFNPLLHLPILGSSNSAANEDMMSNIWTNEDTIFWLSRKHCGKRRNCSLRGMSSFPTVFSKAVLLMRQNEYLWSKGLNSALCGF